MGWTLSCFPNLNESQIVIIFKRIFRIIIKKTAVERFPLSAFLNLKSEIWDIYCPAVFRWAQPDSMQTQFLALIRKPELLWFTFKIIFVLLIRCFKSLCTCVFSLMFTMSGPLVVSVISMVVMLHIFNLNTLKVIYQ